MLRFCVAVAALLQMTAVGYPQAVSSSSFPKLKTEHYQLSNGMQVILCRDPKIPIVHLNLRFGVGSKHDQPGRTGFAHLFEHIMYDGAEAGVDFQTLAERIGSRDVNCRTKPDYTEYYETIPSNRLERMLWLESNRLANLLRTLNQAKFDKQRDVVRNELRDNVENQPDVWRSTVLFQNSFPLGHPYTHDVLGSHTDLMAASLDEVRALFRNYYTPDNLSFVLAGDFDGAQAKQWIAKYFGSLPPGPIGVASPPHSAPKLQAPKSVEMRNRVPREEIFFIWPVAGVYQPDDAALEIAAFVLMDESSRFNAALRGITLGWKIEQEQMQDASLFEVLTAPASGKTQADLKKVIATEIARFARDGPTEEELNRARSNLEFQQLAKLEDLSDLARMLNQVQQFYGGVEHFDEWASRYRRVTAEAVRTAVARWLDTPNNLAIHILPEIALQNTASNTVIQPDRTQPPPFQAEKPFRTPEVKSAKLANGLQLLVVERHELPMVAVDLRFRLGAEYNPPGKAGLAILTMAIAERGTAHRGEDEIEKERLRLAMTLHAGSDTGSEAAGLEVQRANLDPAVDLLADVIRHPSFPQVALESQKKEFVEQYEKADGRIDNFHVPMMSIAFGKAHPVGNALGSTESYRSITRQDVLDFQHRYWKPDAAVLVFAGDITLNDAVAIASKYFGDWEGSAGTPPQIPAPAPMAGSVFLIDRPGATQTNVVQVLPGMPRDYPDYPALLLVNRVWGGIFSSRLVQNLRQEKGIAYYPQSEILPFPGFGLWFAHATVDAASTRDALAEFVKELRGISKEKPITDLELETTKENFIRAYPTEFERIQGLAQRVSHDWTWGLPATDMQTFPVRVSEVTLDEANAIARKYAVVERAFFLLIGDRRKIEPALRVLNIGPVTLLP
jgi:zinc protease